MDGHESPVMLPRMNHTSWLLTVLAAALLLRVAAAVAVQWQLDHRWQRSFLIEGDANGYWHLARQIAAGEEYAIYDPPRRVLRMPGFPAVLAGCILLFDSEQPGLATRIVLACVGAAACGLVYWLGRELVDARTGVIAAGLAAISPALVGFSPLILSETLFAAALLASLIAAARLLRGHRGEPNPMPTVQRGSLLAVLCGVLISLACYVRPSWLLAAPALAAALVILSPQRRTAVVHGILVLVGLFVPLLPWAYRNDRVTGHFVLTTLWVGPSLYDGLNPAATGESDMTFFDRDNLLAERSEYEVDRHYRRAAWRFVRDNPGRTLQLAAIKLWRFWKPWPNADQFDHWTARLAVGGFFLPVLVLAVVGGFVFRNRPDVLLISIGPILYFCAIHLVFVSSLRYRLPAEYPLMVAAAVGCQTCITRLFGRHSGRRPEGASPA